VRESACSANTNTALSTHHTTQQRQAKGRSFYVDRESAMDPPELLQWLTPVDPAAVAAAEAAVAAAAADRDGGGGGGDR
jgi:hypothetical protein